MWLILQKIYSFVRSSRTTRKVYIKRKCAPPMVRTCVVIGLTQKLKGKENKQPVNQETPHQEPNVRIIPYLDILQY